jgi:hypothetical protein
MTWSLLALLCSSLLVLIGLALALPPRRQVSLGLRIDEQPLAMVSAHQLGLAHRLAARLLVSPLRPNDNTFVAAAELWSMTPRSAVSYQLVARLRPVGPLLELEELLEKLDRFSQRIARLGRRRGQS